MKHTECKDCELSNGDCGYHFKMDGTTNYDIASLSACDQYGNCMFFKPKVNLKGDLISREALKEAINADGCRHSHYFDVFDVIDNAPAVELTETEIQEVLNKRCMTAVANEYLIALHGKRPQGKWIPVSERLPEEYGYYLVTTDGSHSAVIDIAEYGKFFRKPENEYVLEWNKASRVIAWRPLPEAYKEGGVE